MDKETKTGGWSRGEEKSTNLDVYHRKYLIYDYPFLFSYFLIIASVAAFSAGVIAFLIV